MDEEQHAGCEILLKQVPGNNGFNVESCTRHSMLSLLQPFVLVFCLVFYEDIVEASEC